MINLLSLPVELQLEIISNIHLNDIEAFTLSCKSVHRLSKWRLMQQYVRERSFSTIAVGHVDNSIWEDGQQIKGVHPLLILRNLLADPPSWLYTKTFIVGRIKGTHRYPLSAEEEAAMGKAELQDVVTQFRSHEQLLKKVLGVQRCVFPERKETDLKNCPGARKWTNDILSGNMEAATSLLIAILPNVHKIRLVEKIQSPASSEFLGFLKDLLSAAVSEKHDLTEINSFSKLTELGVNGLDEEYATNFSVFRGFTTLPSVRTIKGQAVFRARAESFLRGSIDVSNVTSLEFYHSSIDATSFSSALCIMKGLRKFIYSFWAANSDLWEPRRIVDAFEAHTRKTLRGLGLTSFSDTGDAFIDKFKGL